MPCRIYLRADQSVAQRSIYSLPNRAKIFAPAWVRLGLTLLGQRLSGITFEIHESPSIGSGKPVETIKITENFNNLSLTLLQKIARNEPSNVSGKINFSLYSDINEREVIFSIRDLVRQCVIVGVDECSNYGGYRLPHLVQPKQRVYICDLAALQFQQEYNTGRLILIQKESTSTKGILDDLIFEHVVGEPKRSYEEILNLSTAERNLRYIQHHGFGRPCFLDTHAYKRFVGEDVVLAGLAVTEMAYARGDEVEFKFLKYGTGFYAGAFQAELEKFILSGVMDGLKRLFEREDNKVKRTIKKIGLPFFNQDAENVKIVHALKEKYGLIFSFSTRDALQFGEDDKLLVACTNCGDNHAACGNEMRYQSVDAAIAENIESKGNILCPNINQRIEEQYLDISTVKNTNNGGKDDYKMNPEISTTSLDIKRKYESSLETDVETGDQDKTPKFEDVDTCEKTDEFLNKPDGALGEKSEAVMGDKCNPSKY